MQEAVEEMSNNFPGLPDNVRDYVATAYRQLPWEDIRDDDVTDREVSRQLRTNILAAQDYNDLDAIDWSQKASPMEIVKLFRKMGRVRCDGHIARQQDYDEEPIRRSFMSNNWQEYLLEYASFDPDERPMPFWVLQAAKSRAEIAWDHDGTMIYPPELDHSDLDLTLQQLTTAEDAFFQVRLLVMNANIGS